MEIAHHPTAVPFQCLNVSFFKKKKGSIVLRYTLLQALFNQRSFPKRPVWAKTVTGAPLQTLAAPDMPSWSSENTGGLHVLSQTMSWLENPWTGWTGALPTLTFQSTACISTWLIIIIDERFCSGASSPSLEKITSSPVWDQQLGPNKTLHLQITDFFFWPPTWAIGQFSAETNHFHKCFQGVLWNAGSEGWVCEDEKQILKLISIWKMLSQCQIGFSAAGLLRAFNLLMCSVTLQGGLQ